MESAKLQSFLEKAEDRLAGIRASLLLFSQGRLTTADLVHGYRKLEQLKDAAGELGLVDAANLAAECAASVELLAAIDGANLDASVNKTLDLISQLEAGLMQMPLGSEDFLDDVNELVDASFAQFKNSLQDDRGDSWQDEDFEIDDETIEIFRSEAEGLLATINSNLKTLRSSPDDSNALWEIRRNAHTFKGAAGIVGFAGASQLAHRIEDLLDKMVELRCSADARLIDLLTASTTRLDEMTSGKAPNDDPKSAARLTKDFDRLIDSISAKPEKAASSTAAKQSISTHPVGSDHNVLVSMPVVRVSLDRLDNLLKISRGLLANRTALAERFAGVRNSGAFVTETDPLTQLETLLEIQQKLSDELLQRLMQIRMVRFGNLEMRLNRAVHVTAQEENKKAFLDIENGDLEVDTLVIDALVEPLLHLLKNAVVHGIEPPETRRLLGKSEKGRICVSVSMDNDDLILSVEDDGRGISTAKLIEKAIVADIIDEQTAATLDEFSAQLLVFEKGLTTADSLNLNAGRGIGMSIVKESIEARGGSLTVESEQQQGTKFTMRMPVSLAPVPAPEPEPQPDTQPLVLVVDDSASIRRMTAKIVEDAGLRAITAVSGADALELLLNGEWEPDLILSDVEMPVMDGWELLEYVKTDDNFGHIPVVMVTSLDAPHFKQKAFGLGASDYLVKPFSLVELERVCGSLLKAEPV